MDYKLEIMIKVIKLGFKFTYFSLSYKEGLINYI